MRIEAEFSYTIGGRTATRKAAIEVAGDIDGHGRDAIELSRRLLAVVRESAAQATSGAGPSGNCIGGTPK